MGGRGQRKDKTTQKFMQALLGVTLAAHANPPPALPEEAKRAKDLYSSFINKGKRAKAWKELESLLKTKPCSALCITAAKMHMIATVEQVCKAEDDAVREAAALQGMHNVLEAACHGALEYTSIQCVVLAVFTLHTCRGRGTVEQLRWRRRLTTQLEACFAAPAASAAKWGKTKWVDPRIESYEKDRFPFEWEPYSSKNLKEWIEAVRDDWNKFVPTIARADQLAEEGETGVTMGSEAVAQRQRAAEGRNNSSDSVREEIGTPVDFRLAGSFALKHCDKDAIRRHLDALEAKRKPLNTALTAPQAPPKPASTPASTRAGRAATAAAAAAVVQLAAAAGKEDRTGGLWVGVAGAPPAPPVPPSYSRGGPSDNSLLPPHQGVGKGRERHRAEQKRQQAQRAQQRAAEIQQYLAQQLEGAGDDQAAQKLLADSCCMGVDEFAAAVIAAVAAKELTQTEADLAIANLERLMGADGLPPRHVWYGDPHLDIPEGRHEVEGQEHMEELLNDHLQQDWMLAEEATDWVGSYLDGWRDLLVRMGLEANTMTDVDRNSMLAQEDPSVGHTLVRVWTEDYPVLPPAEFGIEVDEAADAELEALLPAGARPCSCGRCQREQQHHQQVAASSSAVDRNPLDSCSNSRSSSSSNSNSLEKASSSNGAMPATTPGAGVGAEVPCTTEHLAPTRQQSSASPPKNVAAAASQPVAANGRGEVLVAGPVSSPSRVQLAQQQWREAMHSEEYGSVLQLDVYINEAERSQQYLDSILGRPEGLMQQCRVLAANPEGAPSNEADELVRRALVGHLMLRLAGAWDGPQQHRAGNAGSVANETEDGIEEQIEAAAEPAVAVHGMRSSITETLQLLRRAMDPSCDLETLIMDCSIDEKAGRAAVQKLGQLREAELAAEAAASKCWAGPHCAKADVATLGSAEVAVNVVGAAVGAHMEGSTNLEAAREDDGAISRPVTFCTPLLTTVLEGVVGPSKEESGSSSGMDGGDSLQGTDVQWQQERERLLAAKGQLARSALLGLGQIWRRRRLTDKMSFQLCQFIADSLATCGELSSRPAETDVLRRAAERLLVGPAPAPCVLRLAGWLPLRVLRHLYTFVVLLVGECFASPQDLSPETEDMVYADASAGTLIENGTMIAVRPAVFAALTPVQPSGAQAPFMDSLIPEQGSGKKKAGRFDAFGPLRTSSAGKLVALSDSFASGEGAGSGSWLARVAAYVCSPSEAQQAQQAQQEGGREEVVGDLHKLWHVEGVLLGLANLCEYWERGLDDSLANMEALRATLDQAAAGTKDLPEAASTVKGSFQLEQQLLEARKVLQATEAVELSLRLAVIKMHGVCFEDVLNMLRERSPELELKDEVCTAAAISKFECMLRDSSAEGDACRMCMQELAVSPTPQLEGKELETVRALGLVLGAGQAGKQQPSEQKIRALLAARPERWEATLNAGRELVLGTLRRLDECTEALATLGEWCYIKQCSLIGQLRTQYCTHSCGDEIVGVLLRLLAVQRWEPAILAEQERERSALAEALEIELEAEREREAQARAAKKAQRAKQKASLQVEADSQEAFGSQQADIGPQASGELYSTTIGDASSSEDEGEVVKVAPSAQPSPQQQNVNGEGDWVADLLARQQPWAQPAATPIVAQSAKQADQPSKPAKQQQQQQTQKKHLPPQEVMRVVSYLGDWLCTCGHVNKLRDPCSCGQMEPCRNWVRGVCDFPQCRYPHPPFDLPATTYLKKSARIANPSPDAPIYGKPQAEAAASAGTTAAAKQVQQKRVGVVSTNTLATHQLPAAAAAVAQSKAGTPAAAGASIAVRQLSSICSSSSSGSLYAEPPNAWGMPLPALQPSPFPLDGAPATVSAPAASSSKSAAPSFAAAVAAAERVQPPPGKGSHNPLSTSQQAAQSRSGSTSAATSGRASPAPVAVGTAAVAAAASASSVPIKGVPQGSILTPEQSVQTTTVVSTSATASNGRLVTAAAPTTDGGLPGTLSQPAWDLYALGQQQQQSPQKRQLQEEAQVAVDEEEAYFSCFNSQVFRGLGLGGPDDFGHVPPPAEPAPPRAHTPPTLPAGGDLREHNSLLVAIVLCLWHCTEFREEMRSWPEPVYVAHPVVKALYSLFHALAEAGSSNGLLSSGLPGGRCPLRSLNAGELQDALSVLPGQLFRTGELSDAGDVLLAMYERIQEVAAMRGKPMLANIVFGIPVNEAVRCRSCQRVTHQASYMQYLFTTQAAALREHRRILGQETISMGRMLHLIASQTKKHCDKDAGGCGSLSSVNQMLQGAPRIFTLQLGWGKQREDPQDIANTLREVQEQVDLADLYEELVPRQFVYRMHSMVCYSGAAHVAFVLVPERGGWLLFEDSVVSCVGPCWNDVLEKCQQQRIQPSVLFYNANGADNEHW